MARVAGNTRSSSLAGAPILRMETEKMITMYNRTSLPLTKKLIMKEIRNSELQPFYDTENLNYIYLLYIGVHCALFYSFGTP